MEGASNVVQEMGKVWSLSNLVKTEEACEAAVVSPN